MSTGTQEELERKALAFLETLEIGARTMGNLRGQNTQTGHRIIVVAASPRENATYDYTVDGKPVSRGQLLEFLKGGWVHGWLH